MIDELHRAPRRTHGVAIGALCIVVGGTIGGDVAATLAAQTPAAVAPNAFDVVTIRQNNAPAGPRYFRTGPDGRVEIRGLTLRDMIRVVYGQSKYQAAGQIVGGPPWVGAQRFDLDAIGKGDFRKTDPTSNDPPPALVAMMRTMLESRFKLKASTGMQELDYYVMRRAKPDALGPQLRPRASCQPQSPGVAPDPAQSCGIVTATPGLLTARAYSLDQLAQLLPTFPSIGRMVRNETGLAGIFDMDMTYTPAFINEAVGGKPVPNPNAGTGPTVFAAFEQQLGLTLDARRGPIDVVVVEHAELP
jgi:uncharacterized protein (TIGR03435 family)